MSQFGETRLKGERVGVHVSTHVTSHASRQGKLVQILVSYIYFLNLCSLVYYRTYIVWKSTKADNAAASI